MNEILTNLREQPNKLKIRAFTSAMAHKAEGLPRNLPQRVGLDIGRVILKEATDTNYGLLSQAHYLEAEYVEDAIDAISIIVSDPRVDQVYLVSKCGPVVAARTMQLLNYRGFFDKTHINRANVHFCREHEQKAGIAERLGLTHFVDDRKEVLLNLPLTVHTRLLFTDVPSTIAPGVKSEIPSIIPVNGWMQALVALDSSLS